MEKRVLLAVTLSILIILAYPLILAKLNLAPKAIDTPQSIVHEKHITPPSSPVNQVNAKEVIIEKPLPSDAVTSSINTDKYDLSITNIGGVISKVTVKDSQRQDMALIDKAFYGSGILSIDGKGALSNLSSQPFSIKDGNKTLYIENSDFKIEKYITPLEGKYSLDTSIEITNYSEIAQALSFDITAASNISQKEQQESRYVEAEILYKDGSVKKITGRNLLSYNMLYKNDIEWISLKNKYYAIIAKPMFDAKGVFTKVVSGQSVIGFIVEDDTILPKDIKIYKINFYMGPMELKELEKADRSFNKVLNFGFLTSISLILLSILQFFYGIFHNYGVSIIFLTCCTSLFLYPLTFKSLKSMQKLQELQPHIEKLRISHKDNPTKLNKEIMELYKRYKVNPMGGCLPMLLQMPVFIALYNTLSRSVELKDAGFLWIKDLSMPDALFRLSFSVPLLGNTINLLPILMIGAMIIQQKTSQATQSAQTDQQKMMANIMPVIFGFIFYSLPSGLVLYWLINTIITSAGQMFIINKRTTVTA